jgi:formamidopyrimidine-DNA glycosylase
MPELPEVETTRQGIAPYLRGQRVASLVVHNRRLRWPVTPELDLILPGQTIKTVDRRAKYLLICMESGTLIVHLGMSGSLRLTHTNEPRLKHDHIELHFENCNYCLRYCDPRRFGAWLWATPSDTAHPLLTDLGPEPLSRQFNARYLYQNLQKRRQAIKTLIMDGHIVVGVGNIYANEALFMAGINPHRQGSSLTETECQILVSHIKTILRHAIRRGGTTLRDFVGGDGKPGYFAQELMVYGRGQKACKCCSSTLLETRIGQRTTVFCPRCQPE